MKTIQKIFVKTAFIGLILISTLFSSFSQTRPDQAVTTEPVSKIQFAGTADDMLLFDLKLQGLPASGCTLNILDDAGNIIFENWINDTIYTKRYKIVRNGSSKIAFEVTGKGFFFTQSFTIRTEERLLVTKEEKSK